MFLDGVGDQLLGELSGFARGKHPTNDVGVSPHIGTGGDDGTRMLEAP